MGDTKKLEIGDLPARAKVLNEDEAAGVFGGKKTIKRGKKRPVRKPPKGKKVGKKPGKKSKGKKRPQIFGGKRRP